MSGSTELELGAQTRAAAVVQEALTPLQTTMRDLVSAIEAEQAGFRGGAAAGFAEAVGAWFEAAQDLLPTLAGMARSLAQTDVTAAQADAAQAASYERFAQLLGGGR
ncbi:MAG: WXG100 family type VII secretion target [Actinomycetes bacterium]